MDYQKFFLKSQTIWALIVAFLLQAAPIAAMFGYDIAPEEIKQLDEGVRMGINSVLTVLSLIVAWRGRFKAETHLTLTPNTKV